MTVGVIIGIPDAVLTVDDVQAIKQRLEDTFPGVTFGVIGGASGMVAFEYGPRRIRTNQGDPGRPTDKPWR